MKKVYIIIHASVNENMELIQLSVSHGKKWKFDSIEEAENFIKDISLKAGETMPSPLNNGNAIGTAVPLTFSDKFNGVLYIQESYSI